MERQRNRAARCGNALAPALGWVRGRSRRRPSGNSSGRLRPGGAAAGGLPGPRGADGVPGAGDPPSGAGPGGLGVARRGEDRTGQRRGRTSTRSSTRDARRGSSAAASTSPQKMYEYLIAEVGRRRSPAMLVAASRRRGGRNLANGSAIEVLTQSARSVRGQRVHRLKCDEVDEFSPEVWQAAQFITQSGPGRDGRLDPGPDGGLLDACTGRSARWRSWSTDSALRIAECGLRSERTATRHLAAGLEMGTLPIAVNGNAIDNLTQRRLGASGPLLLTWCLWEVIERCPPDRSCSRCPLWADCGGKARQADGYFPIERRHRPEGPRQPRGLGGRDAVPAAAGRRPGVRATSIPRGTWRRWRTTRPCRSTGPSTSATPTRSYAYGCKVKDDCGLGIADCRIERRRQRRGLCIGLGLPMQHRDFAVQSAIRNPQSEIARRRLGRCLEPSCASSPNTWPASGRSPSTPAKWPRTDPGPVLATFADPAGWQRSDVTGTGPARNWRRWACGPRRAPASWRAWNSCGGSSRTGRSGRL